MKRRQSFISEVVEGARDEVAPRDVRRKLGEDMGNGVGILDAHGSAKRGSLMPLPQPLKPPPSPSIPHHLKALGERVGLLEKLPTQFNSLESEVSQIQRDFARNLESSRIEQAALSTKQSEALATKAIDLVSRISALEAQTSEAQKQQAELLASSLAAQKAEAEQLIESAKTEFDSRILQQAGEIEAKLQSQAQEAKELTESTAASLEAIAMSTKEQLVSQSDEIAARLKSIKEEVDTKVDELQSENAHERKAHERRVEKDLEQHKLDNAAEIIEVKLLVENESTKRMEDIAQSRSILDTYNIRMDRMDQELGSARQNLSDLEAKREVDIKNLRQFVTEMSEGLQQKFEEGIGSSALDLDAKIQQAQEAVVECHLNAMGKIDNFALRIEEKVTELFPEDVKRIKLQLKADTWMTIAPLAKEIAPGLVEEIKSVIAETQEKIRDLHDSMTPSAAMSVLSSSDEEGDEYHSDSAYTNYNEADSTLVPLGDGAHAFN